MVWMWVQLRINLHYKWYLKILSKASAIWKNFQISRVVTKPLIIAWAFMRLLIYYNMTEKIMNVRTINLHCQSANHNEVIFSVI